jgi:arabinogalactan oligomer/maltooligosaccharide transport system permease protein
MAAWESMFGGGVGGSNLIGQTFMYILGWTIVWAIFATFTNYILGIVLALLINKKSIKFKSVYRTFFVISIAIPQFVTLLAMSKILGPGGPINAMAHAANPEIRLDTWWLNDPANQGLSAKICLILVNVWIGIPYTMLSTSGILLNIPEDLYESASIDGANPWTQFWKITMPYILFVTGPSLLTSFIGNINNFNVIFFLTGGGPSSTRKIGILNPSAGYTDLLITFLFKITVNSSSHQYALGSVIGILVFAICAFFSLIMYSRMGSTQNEEAFQ